LEPGGGSDWWRLRVQSKPFFTGVATSSKKGLIERNVFGNPGRSIQPSFKKKVDQEGAQASLTFFKKLW